MSADVRGSEAVTKYRVQFEPRTYPMLGIVIVVLWLLAGVSLISLAVTTYMLVTSPPAPGESPGLAIAVNVVAHLVAAIGSVATAESITVWIDIQRNTQETAHYLKMQHLQK